ncbi:hypothetical protein QJ48_00910, partial [Paenibacillus sp. A3]|uniref:hypothetical protein n=1 Tax=Paenibacillus sp. A3 TaxID=1337054 RepID=UPI0006E5AD80
PYINELLIFCHEISYNNYLLTIEVEMRNCSETIKNICIDNFLLLGDRKISVSQRSPGIWNGHWFELRETNLMPGESVKIRLYFHLKPTENKLNYKVMYINNHEAEKIHSFSN